MNYSTKLVFNRNNYMEIHNYMEIPSYSIKNNESKQMKRTLRNLKITSQKEIFKFLTMRTECLPAGEAGLHILNFVLNLLVLKLYCCPVKISKRSQELLK
ncbi:hypothetical protein AB832_00815 [Flavobacteriaceae bacterium (ex Bugula neritina AB1)]|nr:hypothetical protein AB832_00815 [Flavobacteriaceae bacterium (ex Bugula neritina AB1)]